MDETDIISSTTARLAEKLGVEAIISLTSSGQSAKKLARYRIEADIYAVTHDERTARSLTIAWGVKPVMNIEAGSLNLMLGKMLQRGIERGLVDIDKSYIVTAGYPSGIEGSTNFIRILKRAQIEHYIDMVL